MVEAVGGWLDKGVGRNNLNGGMGEKFMVGLVDVCGRDGWWDGWTFSLMEGQVRDGWMVV